MTQIVNMRPQGRALKCSEGTEDLSEGDMVKSSVWVQVDPPVEKFNFSLVFSDRAPNRAPMVGFPFIRSKPLDWDAMVNGPVIARGRRQFSSGTCVSWT